MYFLNEVSTQSTFYFDNRFPPVKQERNKDSCCSTDVCLRKVRFIMFNEEKSFAGVKSHKNQNTDEVIPHAK